MSMVIIIHVFSVSLVASIMVSVSHLHLLGCQPIVYFCFCSAIFSLQVPSGFHQLFHSRVPLEQKEKSLWLAGEESVPSVREPISLLMRVKSSHTVLPKINYWDPCLYSIESEITFYLCNVECDSFPPSSCNLKMQCRISQEIAFQFTLKIRVAGAKASRRSQRNVRSIPAPRG